MIPLAKIKNVGALNLKKPAIEDMPLYRIQLALTIGRGDNVGTDDGVYVQMNNGDPRFYLDTGIDDFKAGSTVVYDFLSAKIKKVRDLQFLHFGIEGNDGARFKKIELYLNGMNVPVFSKEYPGAGFNLDNDEPGGAKKLTIEGPELRNSQSWKTAMNSEDIWLPLQKIPKSMMVSLIEAAIGNQLNQQNGAAWGNTSGINTRWGDVVEVKYVDEKTLHIDLDLQKVLTGPNPELDIDFDLVFGCVDGVIDTSITNVTVGTNWVGKVQGAIREKVPLIAIAIGSKIPFVGPAVGAAAGAYGQGLLMKWLSFSLNFSVGNPGLSQSCKLIRVTPDCDLVLF